MRAAALIKALLLLALVSGIAAIVVNFQSRQAPQDPQPQPELLDPDIERQTTRFEYSERKEGKVVYLVSADKSTLTVEGLQRLEGVRLRLYKEDGPSFDTVEGAKALYRIEEKHVEFSGDVRILLADRTEIRSAQVSAYLQENLILIDRSFEFQRGDVRGKGASMRYRTGRKDMKARDFQLEIPSPGGDVSVEAQRASYDVEAESVSLEGDARARRSGAHLSAKRIDLSLTAKRRIRRIASQGQARFSPRPQQVFSGDRILKEFDPASGSLLDLQVSGAQGGLPAVYQQLGEEDGHRLEAERIHARPRRGAASGQFSLDSVEAQGGALFSSLALGVESCRSRTFLARFSPQQERIRQVVLKGGVELRRSPQPDESQLLRSRQLFLDLDDQQALTKATAPGPAEVEMRSPSGLRRLSAGEAIDFDFESGRLSGLQAKGGCLLESREGQRRETLRASDIAARFERGKARTVTAQGGVTVDLQGQRTTSRSLNLEYRQGLLARAVQSGDVELSDPASGVNLQGDQAIYDPRRDTLRVGAAAGQPPGRYALRYQAEQQAGASITHAGEYRILRREGNRIVARQDVVSLFEGDSPQDRLEIRAGSMSVDPQSGLIEYADGPRLDQPGGRISARILRIEQTNRVLEAEGQVESVFQGGSSDTGESAQRSFSGRAQRLRYDPAARRVSYQQEVRLKSGEELDLQAPFADILLAEGSQGGFRSVEAWGDVLVGLDSRRQASGRRAVYDPASDKVVITGQPVVLTDSEEGSTARGARLVFFIGSDRMRLEPLSSAGKTP